MSTPAQSVLEAKVSASLAQRREELLGLSHTIHANPELGNREFAAAAAVAELLRTVPGAEVSVGVGSLETAVRAQIGNGELTVTVCSEYDALPGIGHGCGHNIIAAAGVGAFLALAPHVEDLGITLRLLGTPAEETTGGKIAMLDEGAFDGTHVAMMVHAFPEDSRGMRPFAAAGFRVTFTGRGAHASAAPFEGINALDAMTITLNAIALNRQQLRPFQQMHGFVVSGGIAPNIIPETAVGEFLARADTAESLEQVTAVLMRSIKAGAIAAGAEYSLEKLYEPFLSIRPDHDLEAVYAEHSAALGRPMKEAGAPAGSTDMGNVSQVFPSIHPLLSLGDGCPPPHTEGFAAYAGGPAGDSAVMDGAGAMALTAVSCALDPERRARLLAGGRR